VPKVLTYDRDIFSELDWTEIADTLKEYCQIFRNRMHLLINQYENLYNKIKAKNINAEENEEFLDLYKILRAYGEVDDIPIEMLNDNVNDKLDSLLDKLDKVLKNE